MQRLDVAGRGHTQLAEGLGHTLFKNVLQLVPLPLGLGADVAGHVRHAVGGFSNLLFGHGLRLALNGHTFFDQGFKHFAAFFLRLREGPQARQPDLLRRILDGAGQLGIALLFVVAGLLHFLGHGDSGMGKGGLPGPLAAGTKMHFTPRGAAGVGVCS